MSHFAIRRLIALVGFSLFIALVPFSNAESRTLSESVNLRPEDGASASAFSSAVRECGNGEIDPGETCDPPSQPGGASGNECRGDCSVCGDGVTDDFDSEVQYAVDGGFEDWLDGLPEEWSVTETGGTVMRDLDDPFAGTGALRLTRTQSGLLRAYQTVTGLTPGESFSLGFWFKTVGAAGTQMPRVKLINVSRSTWLNVDGDWSAEAMDAIVGGLVENDVWQEFSIGFQVPEDYSLSDVYGLALLHTGPGIPVVYDEVSLLGSVPRREECDDGNNVDDDTCGNDCTSNFCGDGETNDGEACDDGNTDDLDGCRNDCTIPACGDSILDPGEECDDGNDQNDDGCRIDCTIPSCGDGITDDGEECDDGNDINEDSCRTNCNLPSCGDEILDPSEECDDGNTIDEDSCRNDCTLPFCGDGITDDDEECDDGNDVNEDSCRNGCTLPFCGDGITDDREECDDGNDIDEDSCRNACRLPACGDGITDDGEECDDGNDVDEDSCRLDCLLPFCGDGITDDGEECDDGNDVDEDSCRTSCTLPFCGDQIVDDGEECDDGNDVDEDSCRTSCTLPFCGDGFIDEEEECDDGNDLDEDACRADCTLPFCGDELVDDGEECDDGNDVNLDACRDDCTLPFCGDGIVDTAEECDDGNDVDEDGCRNTCELPFCGDGIVDPGEECDDGNIDDGDFCASDCTKEEIPCEGLRVPIDLGWNLVGPAFSLDLDAEGMCQDVANDGGDPLEVDQWKNGGWQGHICSIPFNNFQIDDGRGYFALANDSSTWCQNGRNVECPITIDLDAGWNTASIPLWAKSRVASQVCQEIAGQGGLPVEIDRWTNGGWESHVCGKPFNDFELLPGSGYFINVAGATSWSLDCGLIVSNITNKTFSVSWLTETSQVCRINYGTDTAVGSVAYDDRGLDTNDDTHHITLFDLEPDTLYYYGIDCDGDFDDLSGLQFTQNTGQTLRIPSSDTVYGVVRNGDGSPASGTIVYVQLQDGDGLGNEGASTVLSDIIDESDDGYWVTNLGSARTQDLEQFFSYSLDGGDSSAQFALGAAAGFATQTVDTSNDSPSPTMTLSLVGASFPEATRSASTSSESGRPGSDSSDRGVQVGRNSDDLVTVVEGPYVVNQTDTSFSIVWRTNRGIQDSIRITDNTGSTRIVPVSAEQHFSGTVHSVAVGSLRPTSEYLVEIAGRTEPVVLATGPSLSVPRSLVRYGPAAGLPDGAVVLVRATDANGDSAPMASVIEGGMWNVNLGNLRTGDLSRFVSGAENLRLEIRVVGSGRVWYSIENPDGD